MGLKERITSDMTAAMKSKEAARLSTLRMVKAAVQNREIEKGGELSDEELTKALQSLVKQRRDSVEQYEKAGREDLAAKERAEITALDQYLPASVSSDEVRAAVRAAISDGASNIGAVMGSVMPRFRGQADGATINAIAREELSKKG